MSLSSSSHSKIEKEKPKQEKQKKATRENEPSVWREDLKSWGLPKVLFQMKEKYFTECIRKQ